MQRNRVLGAVIDHVAGRSGMLLAALVLLAATLTIRLGMGFEFPVPWNDETAFTAQAFEFSRTGSFYVYGLNTERVVMWMPPGYMLLLAAVYKVFGYSFEISRWVSCLLFLGAFGFALGILRQLRLQGWMQVVGLALTLLAFLSPYSLVISNIARMDVLYALMFLASLLAMLRSHYALGLSLVLLSAVVHFNAIYMVLPYAVLIGWKIVRRETLLIGPYELLALCVSVLVLAGYCVFVLKHIGGFLEDMKFQFAYKLESPVMDGPNGWLKISLILLLALSQMLVRRGLCADSILSLYSASFMALALNGHNMWYSFAFVFSIWLLVLSLLLDIRWLQAHQFVRGLVGVLVILLLYPFATYGWEKSLTLGPMWPRAELLRKSFIAEAEIQKVRDVIASLKPGQTVSFGYTGVEQFFYSEFAASGASWSIPMNSVTLMAPARKSDFRIVCDSSLYPKYVFIFDWDVKARVGADSGCQVISLNRDEVR
jgi:hypothetical protein